MDYYVIGPTGQKFGPAPVPILNQWILEGRIAPDSLLEEAGTGAQIVARALPALNFFPAPSLAPPGANPYLMQSPAQNPAYYAQGGNGWRQSVDPGQVLGAWLCTIFSPLLMFCYLGVAGALFALVTGVQLVKHGSKGAGGAMIAINGLWLGLYLAIRIWSATR